MKIKEINRTSTIAWSADVIPLLASGSVAGAVDLDFSSSATLEIWDIFGSSPDTPIFSAKVDHKFHSLAWSSAFENHTRGVLVGALETGALHFWDVDTMIRTKSLNDSLFHTSSKHTGAVKSLSFNPLSPHVLASGGSHGEIFIWDIKSLAEPFAPGTPITPMDEITSVSWNNAVSHILASTSNGGYTSIWDLKAKREVLHLSYSGTFGRADFSYVVWHPSQSTKLATASQSDSCPLIMTWDLRNASEPEQILQGHTKGVLSLDWCSQDSSLLISSGKDNSTRLWNPSKGVKLGDYPTAANWAFITRFAPKSPGVIATASFDGKIVIQTLQDTSPPISKEVGSSNEDDFWSNIAATDTNQAVFEVQQAPQWLKNPSSVSFGFGSKIVLVKNSNGAGSVQISKFVSDNSNHEFVQQLSAAIKADDFTEFLASKLQNSHFDAPDWEALSNLKKIGKEHFLKDIISDFSRESQNGAGEPTEANGSNTFNDGSIDENEDAFFSHLSKDVQSQRALDGVTNFVPAGEFSISSPSDSLEDSRLINLLLHNKISDAVTACLEQGKLLEALVLSLDSDASVKQKVKNHFFSQSKSDTLSRLIYSASSQDVLDIVANSNISCWKQIAASIAAYCKDENEFNSRTIELGDRILASDPSSKENRNNALLCYLSGNSLDKVSAIWLSEIPDMETSILSSKENKITSPFDARYLALGEFVGKLSVYKSLTKTRGALTGPSIEPVCKAVFDFYNMAASGGHFELADQLMALLPDDFAGLKSERERIAKATGSDSGTPQKVTSSNGISKSHLRYNNSRGAANPGYASYNPTHPSPTFARTTVAPISRPIAAATAATSQHPTSVSTAPQANPYIPSGNNYNSSFNPYAPITEEKTPSIGTNNPPVRNMSLSHTSKSNTGAYTGSVRPPSTPSFTSGFPSPNVMMQNNTLAPSNSPPTPANVASQQKIETEGWNDLPVNFNTAKPVARRTPAPVVAPSPKPTPLSQAPKRGQTTQSMSVPPPPKVASRVSSSKSSVPGTPRFIGSPKSKRYAPAIPPSPAVSSSGAPGNGLASPVSTPKANVPPKNPYAPAVVPTSKTTYAAPPTNNFISQPSPGLSRTASQTINPYSPSLNNNARSLSVGQVPIRAPIVQPQGFAPPPSVSRLPSSTVRQNPGQQTTAEFPPPPTRRLAERKISSPSLSQYNGNSGSQVRPPPVAPTNQFGTPLVSSTNSFAPPPVSSTNQVGPPPVSSTNQVGPPLVSTNHVGPPPVASTNHVGPPPVASTNHVGPPPVASTNHVGPPPASSANHVGPPSTTSKIDPHPISSAKQVESSTDQRKPSTILSVHAEESSETAQASTSTEQPFETTTNTQEDIRKFVRESFSAVFEKIKPVAPPKYSKHVADMEKRLGILFGHLEKSTLLSNDSITTLDSVARALNEQKYDIASTEIQKINPMELGDWFTGMKRLVTMAEAFEI